MAAGGGDLVVSVLSALLVAAGGEVRLTGGTSLPLLAGGSKPLACDGRVNSSPTGMGFRGGKDGTGGTMTGSENMELRLALAARAPSDFEEDIE